MKNNYLLFFVLFFASSCTTTFYVVRHAEKSTIPKENPLLTEKGAARAENLKEILKNKSIKTIYSTQTERTEATARPLAKHLQQEILPYQAKNQSELIEQLKLSKNNTLIVGHSNTIRHIINGLAENEILKNDLEDSDYGELYIIKRSKNGKPRFLKKEF